MGTAEIISTRTARGVSDSDSATYQERKMPARWPRGKEANAVWSDNEADIDLLGFDHLKTAVLSIISDSALLPATIGVYGDWGSGKSSLMRMVEADLKTK